MARSGGSGMVYVTGTMEWVAGEMTGAGQDGAG